VDVVARAVERNHARLDRLAPGQLDQHGSHD
jgi:hypothetical protein